MREGQQVRGEKHHFAKLSTEDVLKIRLLLGQREVARKLMEGLTYEKIGRRFGVGRNAIYHLAKENSWAHLISGVDSGHE
jgi:hypothetical protein